MCNKAHQGVQHSLREAAAASRKISSTKFRSRRSAPYSSSPRLRRIAMPDQRSGTQSTPAEGRYKDFLAEAVCQLKEDTADHDGNLTPDRNWQELKCEGAQPSGNREVYISATYRDKSEKSSRVLSPVHNESLPQRVYSLHSWTTDPCSFAAEKSSNSPQISIVKTTSNVAESNTGSSEEPRQTDDPKWCAEQLHR